MGYVLHGFFIKVSCTFSFEALVVVVDSVAVGAQDYAFFNLFVGFGKLSVGYELMYAA